MPPKQGKIQKKDKIRKVCTKAKKRKLFKYSEDALLMALEHIRESKMGIRQASRHFGVPKTTIQDRLKGKIPANPGKTGPPPLLTKAGEARIVDWVMKMAKCGFGITKTELIETVQKIVADWGRKDLFAKGRPGQKWYANFRKRHPEIVLREAESVNKARAIVTEENIRSWFANLTKYLEDNNCMDILNDPDRMLNGDEAGFSLCPKTGRILAPKGCRNVYAVKIGNEKENITILLVFTASGKICPPLVVFPYVRPPRAVVESMPENWILGKSESGWMKGDVFYEYVVNALDQWLNDNNIKRPVLLLIDGHKSHLTMPVSEACQQKQIILYALPPNSTHILQPADVSVFRPLKQEWKSTVRRWQKKPENIGCAVTKTNFCKLLKETLENVDMINDIKHGFRKCGLFPLNPDNVDYTKCVQNVLENLNKHKSALNKETITNEDLMSAVKVIKHLKDNLESYGVSTEVILNEIELLKDFEPTRGEQETDELPLPINATESLNISTLETSYMVSEDDGGDELQLPVRNLNEADILVDVGSDVPTEAAIILSDLIVEEADLVPAPVELAPATTSEKEYECKSPETTNTAKDSTQKSQMISVNVEDSSLLPTLEIQNDNHLAESAEQAGQSKDDSTVLRELQLNSAIPTTSQNQTITDPFIRHLQYPDPISKSNSHTKAKLPSAISNQAWRQHFKEKDEVKKAKADAVLKRKEKKRIVKEQKQRTADKKKRYSKKRARKGGQENIVETVSAARTINCGNCSEELFTDVEDEDEKNIGCDYCPRWYHMRCTEFIGMSYDDVATEQYRCSYCAEDVDDKA